MNFVFLSPHFPPNYYLFAVNMRGLGANVLGLADEPYAQLRPELRTALTEYYQVNDLHNYDELLRACGYFTHRYGKLDRIDSFNEYWLETEARLRDDFNLLGLRCGDMEMIKRKSSMKETFRKAGVKTAQGRIIHTLAEARRFLEEVGYPVVAKPDIGVGAAKTYKIHTPAELQTFFAEKPPVDYIIEEFISGDICTFDGLADQDGTPVFFGSLQYSQGIMETVNNDDLIYYYTLRQIPADLEEAGRRVLKAFGVRGRFFHFEFFRLPEDQSLVALEVNMRPPGGMTVDMYNFASDIDLYREWAYITLYNRFTTTYSRPYHIGYVSRKANRAYTHSHDEIVHHLRPCLIHHESVSGVFSRALGDYGYLVRSPELDEIIEMAHFIQA